MKKPPFQVAPSQSRIAARPKKDTRRAILRKQEADNRLERELPYHNPSAPNTLEELEDFVNQTNYLIQHGGLTP